MKIKMISVLSFFGIWITFLLTLVFPHYLFAHALEYKNFTVYYNSDDMNIEALKSVLDRSEQLLINSELYKENFTQDIFICESFGTFAYFNPLSRKAFGANYPITQNIFLSKCAVSENLIFRNGKQNNQRTLSSVIAHETTHSLLENRLGPIKFKLLPSWKNEGYCDFIANESSYDKQVGLDRICTDNPDTHSASFKYFRYRLIAEYLFVDRKISLDNFLEDKFDLEALNEEVKIKYCTKK